MKILLPKIFGFMDEKIFCSKKWPKRVFFWVSWKFHTTSHNDLPYIVNTSHKDHFTIIYASLPTMITISVNFLLKKKFQHINPKMSLSKSLNTRDPQLTIYFIIKKLPVITNNPTDKFWPISFHSQFMQDQWLHGSFPVTTSPKIKASIVEPLVLKLSKLSNYYLCKCPWPRLFGC